jgi:hypothetical protein
LIIDYLFFFLILDFFPENIGELRFIVLERKFLILAAQAFFLGSSITFKLFIFIVMRTEPQGTSDKPCRSKVSNGQTPRQGDTESLRVTLLLFLQHKPASP